MRVAAVDCGTNSLRLLVAEPDGAGGLRELCREMEIVRLGRGIDATGAFDPDALRLTLEVTARYAATCRALGAERVRFVATSATRDARDREAFFEGVRERLGVEPEVVPGTEEAALSFAGATRELHGALPAPYLTVDLGGGSTEFVLGDEAGPQHAVSVDVGCVRLTERHLRSDPPTAGEVARTLADVDAALDEVAAAVPLGKAATVVGLAGSVTSVTAHVLGLPRYDRDRIHRCELPADRIVAACTDLLGATRERRASLGFMHPGRTDVIGAGALVWRRTVQRLAEAAPAARFVTGEHDILDGIAWSLLEGGVRAGSPDVPT